jgi:hypothetical protein
VAYSAGAAALDGPTSRGLPAAAQQHVRLLLLAVKQRVAKSLLDN